MNGTEVHDLIGQWESSEGLPVPNPDSDPGVQGADQSNPMRPTGGLPDSVSRKHRRIGRSFLVQRFV